MRNVMAAAESDDGELDPETDVLRLLGCVAASVAHDLNNYLGALAAVLTLLEEAPDDRELLAQAKSAVDRSRRLSATIVGHLRGESPAFEEVDLGALVRDMAAFVRPTIPRSVVVRVEVAKQVLPIRAVRSELEQLLLNLVVNAAEAMPDGGELAIRVRPAGAAAMYLEVSDTGPGLPVAVFGRLGHRPPSTKPGKRTGLGLGIVHRVVEHHDGSIAISRREDGAGTVVSVFLPAT
jgi:two-component system, cell cycle sensor histidine kinase and response regulator CckA